MFWVCFGYFFNFFRWFFWLCFGCFYPKIKKVPSCLSLPGAYNNCICGLNRIQKLCLKQYYKPLISNNRLDRNVSKICYICRKLIENSQEYKNLRKAPGGGFFFSARFKKISGKKPHPLGLFSRYPLLHNILW